MVPALAARKGVDLVSVIRSTSQSTVLSSGTAVRVKQNTSPSRPSRV